jgi:hypothetical protein
MIAIQSRDDCSVQKSIPRWLPRSVEFLLGLGILVQAADLVYTQRASGQTAAVSPTSAGEPRVARRRSSDAGASGPQDALIAAHLFGLAPSAAGAIDTSGNPSGNTLRGVFSSVLADWQYAIIVAHDGRSGLYHQGQSLADGWVLEKVGDDFVVLAHGTGREKLDLFQKCCVGGRDAGTALAANGASDGGSIKAEAQSTLHVIGMTAVSEASGELGLRGTGPESWRRAGLRSTDIIIAIDGKRVSEVFGKQAALDQAVQEPFATLTVQRDGQEVQIEAPLEKPAPQQHRRRGV